MNPQPAPASIATIGECLQAGNSDYWVFDMGRRVQPLDKQTFAAIERQQQPYPYPIQQHARIAVLFQHQQQPQQPFLWFLQFPLDERGLLNLAARDEYLQYVITALGEEITGQLSEQQQQQLKNNPYLFTPSEDKRAALHATIQRQRQQPASIHFEYAASYIAGEQPFENWQDVGLQGLHDIAARVFDDPSLAAAIAKNLGFYADSVAEALLVALEHQRIPAAVQNAISDFVQQAQLPVQQLSGLRALASVSDHPRVIALLQQRLASANADELTVIAARHWPALGNEDLLSVFIERASEQPQAVFNALFRDLVMMPSLRPFVLGYLHQTPLSTALEKALAGLQ